MSKSNVIFIFCIVLFLLLRLIGIGPDIANTDAYRWHKRSNNFLVALKTANFQDTYQHYQPGVTLMWLNAFVKQSSFSYRYHILKQEVPKTLDDTEWFPTIHGLSKGAIVIVLAGLLVTQMLVIKELYSEKVALIFGYIVAVEPYLIGIDRWFHLTSLENYLAFTSFLFAMVYSQKKLSKYITISAVFLGFALLTKISAVIALPVILLSILSARKSLKDVLVYIFGVSLIFFIFFPALWSAPRHVFIQIHNAVFNAVEEEGIASWLKYIFYDLVSLYKFSPLTLGLFFVGVFTATKDKSMRYVMAYLVSYYLVLTFSGKKIDRYVLSLFLPVLLVCSFYVAELKLRTRKIIFILQGLYIVFCAYVYFPVFSAYNSPLLGGTSIAKKIGIYDNSGEYFAEAARYLNTKDRDAKVYVPEGTPSFTYYYVGDAHPIIDTKMDYEVASLDTERTADPVSGCKSLEASFGSKESDVVFVYSCK